jgi:hypothetical protein
LVTNLKITPTLSPFPSPYLLPKGEEAMICLFPRERDLNTGVKAAQLKSPTR